MESLYSLSGFQPNGKAHEVADKPVDILVNYAPSWIDLIRYRTPTACGKSVPARRNSPNFGNAPRQEGSSQDGDSEQA